MKNSYKKMYQYVSKMFTACCIVALPDVTEFSVALYTKIIILCLINMSIYALHLYFSIRFLADTEKLPAALGYLWMTVIYGIHRTSLCFNLKKMKILTREINYAYEKIQIRSPQPKLYWLRFWTIVCILIFVLQTIFIIIGNLRYQAESMRILLILYYVTLVQWFITPLNAFSIYYSLMCHQLTLMLLVFGKLINQSTHIKYKMLQEFFIKVKHLIKTVDQNVSIFILFAVIYNAAIMYFALTIFLKPNMYGDLLQRCSIYVLCVSTFISFLTMIVSASGIHQASQWISDSGDVIIQTDQKPSIDQLLFLRLIDKELFMTVYGIVPIKRNFILGISGTLFTYCVVVYNLQVS